MCVQLFVIHGLASRLCNKGYNRIMQDESHAATDSTSKWINELLGYPIEPAEINDINSND